MLMIPEINFFIVENNFQCVQKLQMWLGGSHCWFSMLSEVEIGYW